MLPPERLEYNPKSFTILRHLFRDEPQGKIIGKGDYLTIWQARRIMRPQAKALNTKEFMRPL